MKRAAIFFSLTLSVLGTACTQTNQTSDKRKYGHGSYVQTGSNIPSAYREYPNGPDVSQSELERQQFQNLQTNGTTAFAPRDPVAGRR